MESCPCIPFTIIYEVIWSSLLSAISLWNTIIEYWFSSDRMVHLTRRKILLAGGPVNKSTSSDAAGPRLQSQELLFNGATHLYFLKEIATTCHWSCSLNESVLVHHHQTNESQSSRFLLFLLTSLYFLWIFQVGFWPSTGYIIYKDISKWDENIYCERNRNKIWVSIWAFIVMYVLLTWIT